MSDPDPETVLALSYRQSVTLKLALLYMIYAIDIGYQPHEDELTKPEIEDLLCELDSIEDAAYCIEFLEPNDPPAHPLQEQTQSAAPPLAEKDQQSQ